MVIWPGLKETAERQAHALASRALIRAADPARWSGVPVLPRVFVEVLLDKKVRRGPLPSPAARQERLHSIEASLVATGAMRMALLIFPNRDRNPAKNDGQLPDLGETCALLRLWTICRAMELAQVAFLKERSAFLARATQSDTSTAEQARQALETILLPRAGQNCSDAYKASTDGITARLKLSQSHGTMRLRQLAQELDDFIVQDQESAVRLLLHLAQADKSLNWLVEGLKFSRDLPIKLFAVHDARRYTCYHTDPEVDIANYAHALGEIAEQLGITNLITLISVEELQEQCATMPLQTFLSKRAVIYKEKMEFYGRCYEYRKEALLAITGRERFLEAVGELDHDGKVTHLFEAILHGCYYPQLVAYSQEHATMPQEFQLKFLANIYNKHNDPTLEALQKEILWSTLWGTVQYIASYESNTKTKNHLGLDDIDLLIPDVVRLSIHTKPESAGHFTIHVGPTVHRTPWHGTAAIQPNGKSNSLRIKLSLELKYQGYLPLFISKGKRISCCASHLDKMAECNQPLMWLDPNIDLPKDSEGDIQDLVSKLACLKWM